MRDSAKLVIVAIAGFLYLVLVLGALMVFYGPKERISEGILTAMIVGPMGTALGYLGGILARTEKQEETPQPVTITDQKEAVPVTETQPTEPV